MITNVQINYIWSAHFTCTCSHSQFNNNHRSLYLQQAQTSIDVKCIDFSTSSFSNDTGVGGILELPTLLPTPNNPFPSPSHPPNKSFITTYPGSFLYSHLLLPSNCILSMRNNPVFLSQPIISDIWNLPYKAIIFKTIQSATQFHTYMCFN